MKNAYLKKVFYICYFNYQLCIYDQKIWLRFLEA
jgi:hypothetical protein